MKIIVNDTLHGFEFSEKKELSAIAGISETDAERIYEYYHKK